jgi:hypothetical protein
MSKGRKKGSKNTVRNASKIIKNSKTKKIDKEKIKKLIELANAIIIPASEILPETYKKNIKYER